jgi:excisionase family DNA binding protein
MKDTMSRTPRRQAVAPAHFRLTPPEVESESPEIGAVVESISERLARGKTVSVWVADDEAEVTPREAAQMLGVSRQFVMRLIADGDLFSRRLPGSSHRRVPVEGVVALMARRETIHQRLDEAARALDTAGVHCD